MKSVDIEHKRIFDIIDYQLSNDNPSNISQKERGLWKTYTLQEFKSMIDKLSVFFMKLGIKKGDTIGLVGSNCIEWNIVDVATAQVGGILVPLYPTDHIQNHLYILNNSLAKLLFSASPEILDDINNKKDLVPNLQKLYLFSEVSDQYQNIKQICLDISDSERKELEVRKNQVDSEDLCILTYTSGTTGKPKGVMLTHTNICSNVYAVLKSGLIREIQRYENEKLRCLSFLPLCHVFERTAFYFFVDSQMDIYYAESLETIAQNLQEVKPHYFNSVPRLIEKVYNAIITKGNTLVGVKKKLFFWALNLAKNYNSVNKNSFVYRLKLSIARKLIFSKWKTALGGNIRYIVLGAAATPVELIQIFSGAGIPLLQGYGLSETSPVISANIPKKNYQLIGSVGRLLHIAMVKIEPVEGYRPGEGEILVLGSLVTQGYYRNEKVTHEVLKNGWFYTGDIGMFVDSEDNPVVKPKDFIFTSDQEVFLKITGRKKEIFKTSGGKYIVPEYIESKVKKTPLVEQVMVIGENKNYPSALIVPNFEILLPYCKEKGINITDENPEALVNNEKVIKIFQDKVESANEELGKIEKIKRIRLLSSQWTPTTGELTPTMKLKRKVIMEKYTDAIEKLYL